MSSLLGPNVLLSTLFSNKLTLYPSVNVKEQTERRCQVINNPALYSGILASNFDPKTGYPDRDFSWYSSVPPGSCRDKTLN
jgi:hypothetical protein